MPGANPFRPTKHPLLGDGRRTAVIPFFPASSLSTMGWTSLLTRTDSEEARSNLHSCMEPLNDDCPFADYGITPAGAIIERALWILSGATHFKILMENICRTYDSLAKEKGLKLSLKMDV